MRRCLPMAWLLCAWVLWSAHNGVIDGRSHDFHLLREAFESRKECLDRSTVLLSIDLGERPEVLLAPRPRPGWTRKQVGAWAYRDAAPEGQRGFERIEYVCWPSGTDPRPRGKE
jgi:hypothetical protein